MRLIDADALIEAMKKTEEEYENAMTCPSWWSAYNVIKEQPTAYNLETVVAELEAMKCYESGCHEIWCASCKYNESCLEGEEAFRVALDNAIEIVRNGGKE